NFFPKVEITAIASWLPFELNSILTKAVGYDPEIDRVDIRLYGGWMDDGLLTNLGSALHAAISATRLFPLPHPFRPGLLRGDIDLVTRLAAVPDLEWVHTSRHRHGLPRLRLHQTPLPPGCAGDTTTCPLRALYRISRRRDKICHVVGCTVRNEDAFRVAEQK